MACYTVEVFGWITLTLLAVKSLYNVTHFAYTTFLGRLLGFGTDIRKCGPWAGTQISSWNAFFKKFISKQQFCKNLNSGDGCDRWDWYLYYIYMNNSIKH